MKNKLLAFILVIMLMFGVIGCSDPISSQSTTPPSPPTTEPNQGSTVAPENSKYPDYLNLSGYPIVKDDVEPITLSLLTTRVDSSLASTDINSLWWFEYIKEKMNIQFEAEEVAGDSIDERKSLMFATNQLPDIVMGAGLWLTNNEVVTYGQQEGMVINWSEYLTEELMPNALASMGEYSDAWTAATSLDGNIYALPQIRPVEKYQGTMLPAAAFAFINQKWLDDCGLENPTTLNGFIDTLRAFKELKDDSIPLVSVDNLLNGYLWTALGFNTSAFDYGESPALKNNELVLPCATEEYDIFVLPRIIQSDNVFT
jgi:ABC-type glycerol-3-phosphate transport system substrate-binding protein